MWGSSTRIAVGGGSSIISLSKMGEVPGTNCHFSTVKTTMKTRRRSNSGSVGKPRCSNT